MAFAYDPLWNKSKVFIDRAVAARDNQDNGLFHMWSAVALELLGKATLAKVSPALVADPSHFASLLAACGGKASPSMKSITAKTVFERLTHLSHQFDDKMMRECMTMADRRNAELHSGETPATGLDPRSWVPAFWRACDTLLKAQSRSIDDWLGTAEAVRVREVLADAADLLKTTVTGRIERRKKEFDHRYQPGTAERESCVARAEVAGLPPRHFAIGDAHEKHPCPACGCKGWMFGFQCDSEVIDNNFGGNGDFDRYFEIVETSYGVEEFRCPECGLTLEGREEISLADLPEEFRRQDEREPDYEPEYGND